MKKSIRISILIVLTLGITTNIMAQEISYEFPFDSKYIDVLGSKMHYVDENEDTSNPEQLTFLFLHGNPTSSYLWRNIIPYVNEQGRVVAPDLIGMGKSDKPDIDYTFQDHYKYLEEFIKAKKLKNIVLIIHDWGSGLGFHYASKNENNIKGIVFMEAIVKTANWKDANFIERILFKRFRHDKKGHKMIAENNFFIKTFLFKLGTKRKLTKEEKAYYSAPYPTVDSRKPIEVWPKEIPIEETPYRNYIVVSEYVKWLKETTIPKLLLYAKPGMIIKKKDVKRIKSEFKNIETKYVGKGKHYIQEDQPKNIGEAIERWVLLNYQK
jgi:haloalkane dehalogenase